MKPARTLATGRREPQYPIIISRAVSRRLGGKDNRLGDKEKWQEAEYTLTETTLSWASKGQTKTIQMAEVQSLSLWSAIGFSHAFELASTKKNGKVYHFSATDEADCDAWMAAISAASGVSFGGHVTNPIHSDIGSGFVEVSAQRRRAWACC